jgi:HEAT repeats
MKRVVGLALFAVLVTGSAIAPAQPPLTDLLQKVARGPDFRVRVSAALQLGKTKSSIARSALETALDDENAAVRAAAAAALKVIADPTAVSVLERHANDGSPAVRAQIKTSLASLRGTDGSQKASEKPEVLVQVGKIGSGAPTTGAMLDDVARTSKQKLRELPGVAIVDEGGDRPRRDVPLVMVTGRVKKLEQSREGGTVVCSAAIEFVLHKMPGQTIKGVVSGSAKASGAADELLDARALADLRRSALEAAIDSAVRRAPPALRAAAQ